MGILLDESTNRTEAHIVPQRGTGGNPRWQGSWTVVQRSWFEPAVTTAL